ncbi:MAG: MFS transporter [Siphonobacter sp.]
MILQLYRAAYSGLPRSMWLLAVVMFVNRSGTMVIPFLGVYLTESLRFSIDEAGIIMALFGVGSIGGTLIGGKLTDRIGAYDVMWISLLLGGLMFLLLGQLRGFWLLCLGTLTLGMVAEAFRPAVTAAVAMYSNDQNRTRSYSLNRLALNLGWSIGPAIGGWLAAKNYSFLFWADGITCLGATLMLRFALPRQNVGTVSGIQKTKPSESAFRDRIFLVFMVFVTLYAIGFFQLFSTVPLFYKTVYHLRENQIGNLMALNGLIIVAVEMILVHSIENRFKPLRLMAAGSLLVAIAYSLFNVAFGISWLIVSMVVATFSEMLAMPFMNTFAIGRSKAHNLGQYTSLYTAAWSIAQISAPLLGTQFITRFSFSAAWWLMASFASVACLGFLSLEYKIKK